MNDEFESQGVGPEACGAVRDLLPFRGSGAEHPGLAEMEAHVAACEACRAEAEFIDRLRRARPEPPAGLVEATLRRHAERPEEPAVRTPRWGGPLGVSVAAAAAAVGIGLFAVTRSGTDRVWSLALEPEPAAWYGEEWMVAGGPVPEALSDDVLVQLLTEMEP